MKDVKGNIFEALRQVASYNKEQRPVVENVRNVENMFGLRAADWRKLVKKHQREIEKFQKTGNISKKVEDELLSWAMDNGEVRSKDDAEDFMDIVLNAHFEPEGDELSEMKFNRDGRQIEITKSGPSTKPTFHLKINGKDHGKFDQEKKAMQYVASLKEDDLEEAPKAPKLKGLDMYGAEIRGLRSKTGIMHTAMAVKLGPNKLGFKVVDEFGGVETIDLKTFAKKFG